MWVSIALAVLGIAGGAISIWWAGGWQTRERRAIQELQEIAGKLDPEQKLREDLESHLEGRVQMYVRWARVPNPGSRLFMVTLGVYLLSAAATALYLLFAFPGWGLAIEIVVLGALVLAFVLRVAQVYAFGPEADVMTLRNARALLLKSIGEPDKADGVHADEMKPKPEKAD